VDFGDVHHRGSAQRRKTRRFHRGNAGAHFPVRATVRRIGWPRFASLRVDFDGQRLESFGLGGGSLENQASIASPRRAASQTLCREKGLLFAAQEIVEAKRDINFVPARTYTTCTKRCRARRRQTTIDSCPLAGRRSCAPARHRIASARFLVAEVAANKNNLGAIGGDGPARPIHELMGRATGRLKHATCGLLARATTRVAGRDCRRKPTDGEGTGLFPADRTSLRQGWGPDEFSPWQRHGERIVATAKAKYCRRRDGCAHDGSFSGFRQGGAQRPYEAAERWPHASSGRPRRRTAQPQRHAPVTAALGILNRLSLFVPSDRQRGPEIGSRAS